MDQSQRRTLRRFPALIDINGDGIGDDPDSLHVWWRTGIEIFLSNLRRQIGDGYILIGTGKNCMAECLNGGIREDSPYMHRGWEPNMFAEYRYVRMCQSFLIHPASASLILNSWRMTRIRSMHREEQSGASDSCVSHSMVLLSGGTVRMEVTETDSPARWVSARIYDIRGRLIRAVFEGRLEEGHNIEIESVDEGGGYLAPATYLLVAEFGAEPLTQKIILLDRSPDGCLR